MNSLAAPLQPASRTAPLQEIILADLLQLLNGRHDERRIDASVYDTAQVLRHAPPAAHSAPAEAWLLAQQHADGGWGAPEYPLHRLVPTVAALLALHERNAAPHSNAIRRGLAFLACQHAHGPDRVPANLPFGMELILPRLAAQAAEAHLDLRLPAMPALAAFGAARLERLRGAPAMAAGHPALHCWEAWGDEATGTMLGVEGSLGLSPSATAAWLHSARRERLDDALIRRAERYLDDASRATGNTPAGVVPCIWPLGTFQTASALHALEMGGLHTHARLAGPIAQAAGRLHPAVSAHGAGFAAGLAPDGDTTALVMIALSTAGDPLSHNPLQRFVQDGRAVVYLGDSAPSLSATIHALHALRLRGAPVDAFETHLLQARHANGLWGQDKWHVSWLCPTAHAIAAMTPQTVQAHAGSMRAGLLAQQHADGGWGCADASTFEETACAVLALHRLASTSTASPALQGGMRRAFHWMRAAYRPFHGAASPARWIGKQLYAPVRVVRAVELAGLWTACRWAGDEVLHPVALRHEEA
ncbi:hypothetical protein J2W27_005770 [Variovorax boronicumulans]|uniref:prenyltransferase/squalene oxidase repeat-containing protein n=1 Tax=Variovorax boronicumulans TaxID=436515 RepID=UPI00278AFDB3|nr:prenyltransferase/squalene oxidase repeat-containing protein [Variovorax boronicumulans]MDP9913634.1 hypothetical protein [Variovorax boronicumulans]